MPFESPKKKSNSITKWPFLAGDICLILLACFIAISAPKPIPSLTIFACILSVILGMLVFVTPYLVEHFTNQQRIKIKQLKAEETLLNAVERAAKVQAGMEDIHGEVMKCVLVTRQLPQRIEEKVNELLQVTDQFGQSQIASLKSEINALKSLDISSFQEIAEEFKKAADNPKNTVEIPDLSILEDLKSTLKSLNQKPSNSSPSLADLASRVKELKHEISSMKKAIISQVDGLDNRLNPVIGTDAKLSGEETEIAAQALTVIEPEDEVETEALEEAPPGEPLEAPETSIQNDQLELEPEPDESGDSLSHEDGATRLLVGAFIGISNKLYIRGEGPGLSWDKGVPMDLVDIGKWEWKTYEAESPVSCKVLLNDEQWTNGEDIVLNPGSTVETNASF